MAFDGPLIDDEDELPFIAGIRALGSGASSRLFESVREKHGLCYDVHASYSANTHFGLCNIGAGTTPERISKTIDCIFEELARFGRDGLMVEEFDRVRRGLKTRLLMQGESTSVRAFALARDQHQRGAPRSLSLISDRIDALTHQQVDSVVRGRMGASWMKNPVRIAVGPESPFKS
jgi:predicted Zn-dependent peptidase